MTTEIIFWCIAALLIAAALAAVAAAFMRTSRFCSPAGSSLEQSRALLNEELDLLARERAANLVSEVIYADSVEDVRRRALEDLEEGAARVRTEPNRKTVMALVSVLLVAVSLALYLKVGAPGMIPFVDSQRTQGIMRADGSLAAAAPQYDAPLMSAYLKRNPSDERAWVLLARLYVEEAKWTEAAKAYRSALDLKGKVSHDAAVWVEYAASVMSLPTDDAYDQGIPILEEALRLDEANTSAHELYAIASLETHRWAQALKHLEYLMSRLHMDTPKYRKLAQLAAYAAGMEREEAQAGAKQSK